MQKNQQTPKGFHRLTIEERLDQIASMTELGQDEIQCLKKFGNLPEETANGMVENVIGVMGIPFGVATNLILDGKEMLVPMATEESSVIAAVCNASKQCRSSGGVTSSVSGSEMIAQIQLLGLSNPHYARQVLLEKKEKIRELCDAIDPLLLENGGGFRDLEVRILETRGGTMVILHGKLPHMSEANRSNRTRHAYTLHLIEADADYPDWNWLQRDSKLPLRGFV